MATRVNELKSRIEKFAMQDGHGNNLPKGLEVYSAKLFARDEALRPALLNGEGWEEADLGAYIIGASGDGGLDVVLYSPDSEKVIAIQAKYTTSKWTDSAIEDEINKLKSSFDNLRNKKFRRARLNDYALEVVEESEIFSKDKSVSLFLVTNQPIGDLKRARQLCSEISKTYDALEMSVEIDIYGAAELLRLEETFEDADTGRGIAQQVIEFGSRRFLEIETPNKSIVGMIKGNKIVDLYKERRDSLFELNVRGYLGSIAVNKRIISTAEEQPEDFFYFNNGITATCSSIESKGGGKFIVENLQVVNGAQTVKSLHKALGTSPNDDVLVLFRLIETGERYRKKNNFATEIARFQNTQNRVVDSDFFSNDPIQKWLEENFAQEWSGKGRGNFVCSFHYVRKRGVKNRGAGRQVGIEILGKLRHAVLFGPKVSYREAKTIWSSGEGSKYWEAFGRQEDGETVELTDWDDEELAEMAWALHTLFYLHDEAKKIRKEQRGQTGRQGSKASDDLKSVSEANYLQNLSRWLVALVAHVIKAEYIPAKYSGFQEIMTSREKWEEATSYLLKESRILLRRQMSMLYREGQANPRLNLPGNSALWGVAVEEMTQRARLS